MRLMFCTIGFIFGLLQFMDASNWLAKALCVAIMAFCMYHGFRGPKKEED